MCLQLKTVLSLFSKLTVTADDKTAAVETAADELFRRWTRPDETSMSFPVV